MRASLPLIAVSTVAALASLAACNKTQQAAGPQPAAAPPAVATVNGSAITRPEYDLFVKDLLRASSRS